MGMEASVIELSLCDTPRTYLRGDVSRAIQVRRKCAQTCNDEVIVAALQKSTNDILAPWLSNPQFNLTDCAKDCAHYLMKGEASPALCKSFHRYQE